MMYLIFYLRKIQASIGEFHNGGPYLIIFYCFLKMVSDISTINVFMCVIHMKIFLGESTVL